MWISHCTFKHSWLYIFYCDVIWHLNFYDVISLLCSDPLSIKNPLLAPWLLLTWICHHLVLIFYLCFIPFTFPHLLFNLYVSLFPFQFFFFSWLSLGTFFTFSLLTKFWLLGQILLFFWWSLLNKEIIQLLKITCFSSWGWSMRDQKGNLLT